jgi:phosphoesterase RecJ-like protein
MHEGMDGDDGGSILALQHFLENQGKQVTAVIKHGVPEALSFLPGSHKIQEELIHQKFDLLVTFGCANKERTGLETILTLDVPTINFDHHPDNTFFGIVNIVDKTKSSVAELVYDFFKFCRWTITQDIATCLLTGIITDTGRFMHANTHSSTLYAASDLMSKGARTAKINKHTFKNKKPVVLKAWAKAMENSRFDSKNKIITAAITEEELSELGNLPKSAFEGFVETLNTIPEAKFALFVRQDGLVIKGSLRSDAYKNVDVSKVARLFGGGGHKLAAGFSLAGKITKDIKGQWKIN